MSLKGLTDRVKKDLSVGDIRSLKAFIKTAQDEEILAVIKEQKLLLIPDQRDELYKIYIASCRRILSSKELIQAELNYLDYLKIYILATKDLVDEIEECLAPYLQLNVRDFLQKLHEVFEQMVEVLIAHFDQKHKENHAGFSEAARLTEFSEAAHHSLKGTITDMMFSVTNLVNLFSQFKNSDSAIKYDGKSRDHEGLEMALSLSGNFNSYQYAMDKLSYGEWYVSEINDSNHFVFSIVDVGFEKARDLGNRRVLAQKFIGRNKKRWLRGYLEDIALASFDFAWDYMQNLTNVLITSKLEYNEGRERVLKSLDELDAEDELLVGMNMYNLDIVSHYLCALTLETYVIAAQLLQQRSKIHAKKFVCTNVPLEDLDKVISQIRINGVCPLNVLETYVSELPVNQHVQMFTKPFLRFNEADVFSLDLLSQENWTSWVRSVLMRGGETANIIGKSWEGYLAHIMKENGWRDVAQSIKLVENGRTVTDIDLIAVMDNVLFIIQVKVFYATGVNTYEQWKQKKKLTIAANQIKIASDYLKENKSWLNTYLSKKTLNEVKVVQPIIMTNSHIFNGWKCNGIQVMSTGSLMQVINGAKVEFKTSEGEVLEARSYLKNNKINASEFIEFLEKPLDWRIREPILDVKYHIEKFTHCKMSFPLLKGRQTFKELWDLSKHH